MDWQERKKFGDISDNKKKYHDLMDGLEKIISGRSHSIVPYVTNEDGKLSEIKTQDFINEFLELMDIYANKNLLWFGRIVGENAQPGQKSFCRYMRLYLYLAVQISLLYIDWLENGFKTLPDGSFHTILSGCRDFKSDQDKDNLLLEYACDGFIYDSGVISWGVDIYYRLSDSADDTWMTPDMKRRMEDAFEQLEAESGNAGDLDFDTVDPAECDISVNEETVFHGTEPRENIHEQLGDPEAFCSKFREYMALLYSDEVPYGYLSIMTNAVEGALDLYLCRHNISIYGNDKNMADAVIYIKKAMEKTDMLYKSRNVICP